MKPHPKIRKTIKWGGAAVTVLLLVVWIGSEWVRVAVYRDIDVVELESGRLHLNIKHGLGQGADMSCDVGPAYMPFELGFEWFSDQFVTDIKLPLWCLAVGASIVPCLLWRLDTLARRRAKLNLCPKCGYDRTGLLQDARCPECGAAPASV